MRNCLISVRRKNGIFDASFEPCKHGVFLQGWIGGGFGEVSADFHAGSMETTNERAYRDPSD